MKVLSYQVHNVLRISDVDLNLEGRNLVLVGGKNGHGKSSALNALLMALCGKSGMDWPDIALKEGEDKGSVTVQLSGDEEMHETEGLTVELTLRRKRGGNVVDGLRILDSTGEECPEPRKTLQRLYSMRAFDPLAFERAKPKERGELLRDLMGLDFSALDGEYKEVFAARTIVNKDVKQKQAEVKHLSDSFPTDTPDEPLSVSALVKELDDTKEYNRNAERQCKVLVEMTNLEKKLGDEEGRLKLRLAEIDEERQKLDAEIDQQEKLCESLGTKELAPIQKRIASADEVNRFVEAKRKYTEVKSMLKLRQGESQQLSDRLTEITDTKQETLENAEWPLPGMCVDESGVLLHGLPFEQASKAERLLASIKVGMALNPKLKLLVCHDGNDLDNTTMSVLEKVLKENDYQLLLEYVTRDEADESRCAVVFHEGAPKSEAVDAIPDTVAAE